MHIPPFYKKKSWQRFFVGVFIGGVLSYCVVIYMYGQMYEQLLEKNMTLQSELNDVQKQNESLLKTNEDLDKQSKQPVTVKEINLEISNKEELKLDTFTTHKLEELVKDEIDYLIGEDIQIVTESEELLISAIENKVYQADGLSYYFEISRLTISPQINLTLKAKLEK